MNRFSKKKSFTLFCVLCIGIFFSFPQKSYSKKNKKKPLKEEIVKEAIGFSGEPNILVSRWINKQKDFIKVQFKPGNKGTYLNNGTLIGTTKNGNIVEIFIPEDFITNTPGMILDHLRALRSRLDSSEVSFSKLREQLTRNTKLKQVSTKRKIRIEKLIQEAINVRINEVFENELSSADKSVMANLENELDPIVRAKIVDEIEAKVREDLPDADIKELDREINKRVDKNLNKRVRKEIHQMILNGKLGNNSEFNDARKLVHRIVSRNKPKIELEIRSQVQAKERERYLKLKNKILYGIIPPEKIDNSILGKLKRWWTSIFSEKKE